jgi:hypothetical protein
MNKMMNKRLYQKPATKVVKLQQQYLLEGSNSNTKAVRNDYGKAEESTWE